MLLLCQAYQSGSEPQWEPSEQAPKPLSSKAQKFTIWTNNPWKFLAHTLITQHNFLWICFLCRGSFLLIKLGISKLGCIVRPHRFFLERTGRGWERKFQLPPPEGVNSDKIKKGGGAMVQAQAFLKKKEEEHFFYLIFLRFIIFTFRNYFILCEIVLCIRRKNYATIILWKKVIRNCLKINLEISQKLR